MKSFKFFKSNHITRFNGEYVAVFALNNRHFHNWIENTFQNEIVQRITTNRFIIDGVRYINVTHIPNINQCVFTDYHVIDDILLTRVQSVMLDSIRNGIV